MHRTVAIGPICLLSRSTPTQSSGAPTSFGAKWWKAKIGGLSGACSKQRLAAASNEMLRGANFHWFLASNYPSTLPLVPTNQPTQPNPLSPNNTRSLMLLLHTFHISPRSLCLCSYWKNQTREPNRFQSFHLLYWKGGIRAGGLCTANTFFSSWNGLMWLSYARFNQPLFWASVRLTKTLRARLELWKNTYFF